MAPFYLLPLGRKYLLYIVSQAVLTLSQLFGIHFHSPKNRLKNMKNAVFQSGVVFYPNFQPHVALLVYQCYLINRTLKNLIWFFCRTSSQRNFVETIFGKNTAKLQFQKSESSYFSQSFPTVSRTANAFIGKIDSLFESWRHCEQNDRLLEHYRFLLVVFCRKNPKHRLFCVLLYKIM